MEVGFTLEGVGGHVACMLGVWLNVLELDHLGGGRLDFVRWTDPLPCLLRGEGARDTEGNWRLKINATSYATSRLRWCNSYMPKTLPTNFGWFALLPLLRSLVRVEGALTSHGGAKSSLPLFPAEASAHQTGTSLPFAVFETKHETSFTKWRHSSGGSIANSSFTKRSTITTSRRPGTESCFASVFHVLIRSLFQHRARDDRVRVMHIGSQTLWG